MPFGMHFGKSKSAEGATWTVKVAGTEVARSDKTVQVDGNPYFPPDSIVDRSNWTESDTTTVRSVTLQQTFANDSKRCSHKGLAKYYNIGEIKDAVWYYPDALPEGKKVEGYFAFYKSKVDLAREKA